MSLGSTLSELSNRFTREDQSEKLKKFAESTSGLAESVRTQLLSAVDRSLKNIEWDKQRLTEVTAFWKKRQEGGAAAVVASYTALILSLIAFLMLN